MLRLPALAALVATLLLAACMSYPAPSPGHFDRAWDAALGATADAGVQVTSAQRGEGRGRISGTQAGAIVNIELRPLMDGRIEVVIEVPDAPATQPALNERWLAAYRQRMVGR